MNALDLLLMTSLGTVLFSVVFSASLTGRMLLTMLYALQTVILFQIDFSSELVSSFSFEFFNHSSGLTFNGLS